MSSSKTSSIPFLAVGTYSLMFVAVSLSAIFVSFILAGSESSFEAKSRGFSSVIVVYLLASVALYYLNFRRSGAIGLSGTIGSDARFDDKLAAIEEGSLYFGNSLKSADMFRLVSSRAGEIVPFDASVLFVVDRAAGKMTAIHADGANAERLQGIDVDLDAGLAGHCYASGEVQIDRALMASKQPLSMHALNGLRSAAAVPLIRSGEVFGVLQFFAESRTAFDGNAITLLEAIGTRVTPLILGSLSFERSVTNALTDPVTDLPNERAFHLIIENQIAECQRARDSRPLALLTMDVRDFDDINSKYGHASGDRVLRDVADLVKMSLREMDFFARACGNEFLAVLPTANSETADDVVARIQTSLFSARLKLAENEYMTVELNFGAATFGHDGETAEQMLATARTRRRQATMDAPMKVLWFPREIAS